MPDDNDYISITIKDTTIKLEDGSEQRVEKGTPLKTIGGVEDGCQQVELKGGAAGIMKIYDFDSFPCETTADGELGPDDPEDETEVKKGTRLKCDGPQVDNWRRVVLEDTRTGTLDANIISCPTAAVDEEAAPEEEG